MGKNGHPLEIMHAEFLRIADEKERNFIEADNKLPEVFFFGEGLSFRYSMYQSLQGEIIGGEQEDFLYPHQGIAAKLLNSLHSEGREILMEEMPQSERDWDYQPSEIESRFTEGKLRPDDFLLFDGKWNAETDIPEDDTPADSVNLMLAHEILQAIHQKDPSDETALLLKWYDEQATMALWTNFSDFPDARIEFWVRREMEAKLTNSTHFQLSGFGNNIEHRKFEETINNLQRESREQIILYLQHAEERATEHRKKNRVNQPKNKARRFANLLSNIRLGKLPLNDWLS